MMMTKLRGLTKWGIIILVLSFLGLMVVDWGADYSGMSSRTQSIVGNIEGQEISWEQFNDAIRNARYIQEQRSGVNLTEEEMNTLRNQVWENLVQRVVLKKEIDKLDIKVTDKEITDQTRQSLREQLAQRPEFQTNGRFDEQKFTDFLNNPDLRSQLVYQEYQIQQELPYYKLVEIMNASVIITEQEMREEFMKQNVKSKIEFLHIPAGAFIDREISITDNDIQSFYNDHREDYKVNETRNLNFVFFSEAPTSQDTAAIYEKAEYIRDKAVAGEDFTKLADAESDDPRVKENHGDLGAVEKNGMPAEFTDALFTAKAGSIVGPIKTRLGLHIIKAGKKTREDGKEKVQASHILLKFEAGATTIDNVNRNAELFAEKVKQTKFSVIADQLNVEVKSTNSFSFNEAGRIPGVLGNMQNAMAWAFNSQAGEKSDVYYVSNGRYIFEVAEIVPEGYRLFEEVKEICKQRIENEKRMEFAKEYAEKFAAQAAQADFKKLAETDPDKVLSADTTGFFSNNPANAFIPKIGRAASVIAKAFSLPVNETSGMLKTNRGYYFIRVLDRTEFDETSYSAQKADIRNQILQSKMRDVFNKWYINLKKDCDIQDNRFKFYRS